MPGSEGVYKKSKAQSSALFISLCRSVVVNNVLLVSASFFIVVVVVVPRALPGRARF